jgi:hypothetical protein
MVKPLADFKMNSNILDNIFIRFKEISNDNEKSRFKNYLIGGVKKVEVDNAFKMYSPGILTYDTTKLSNITEGTDYINNALSSSDYKESDLVFIIDGATEIQGTTNQSLISNILSKPSTTQPVTLYKDLSLKDTIEQLNKTVFDIQLLKESMSLFEVGEHIEVHFKKSDSESELEIKSITKTQYGIRVVLGTGAKEYTYFVDNKGEGEKITILSSGIFEITSDLTNKLNKLQKTANQLWEAYITKTDQQQFIQGRVPSFAINPIKETIAISREVASDTGPIRNESKEELGYKLIIPGHVTELYLIESTGKIEDLKTGRSININDFKKGLIEKGSNIKKGSSQETLMRNIGFDVKKLYKPKKDLSNLSEFTPTQSSTSVKVIALTSNFTRDSVKKDSDYIYLFTDNAKRTSGSNKIKPNWYTDKYGIEGNYPTMTQAIIRGLENAFPITTMMDDNRTQWTDDKFEEFKQIIDSEISEIKDSIEDGDFKGVKFAAQMPFGKGKISNMKDSAPKIWNYLNTKLAEIGIDNTGAVPVSTQSSTSVKPTIDTSREWSGDLKTRLVYTAEGVNTMRTEVANKDEHFGNPFSEAGYGNTIKVDSIADAVIAYKDWLLNGVTLVKTTNKVDLNTYLKPFEAQRTWILNQINQGKLDGATLLYAGKSANRGQGMHPTALAEVVEQLRTTQSSTSVVEKSVTNLPNGAIVIKIPVKVNPGIKSSFTDATIDDNKNKIDEALKLIAEAKAENKTFVISNLGIGQGLIGIDSMTGKPVNEGGKGEDTFVYLSKELYKLGILNKNYVQRPEFEVVETNDEDLKEFLQMCLTGGIL